MPLGGVTLFPDTSKLRPKPESILGVDPWLSATEKVDDEDRVRDRPKERVTGGPGW